MIKFHGGVLHTKALEQWQFAGRSFCVSYAHPDPVEIYHELGQAVLLDNGAYTFWTQKRETNWPAFYEWAAPWLQHQTTWAIIPDVMDGTDEANDELVDGWLEWAAGHGVDAKEKGWPVWHMPESLDRLDRLCDEWPVVCLSISSRMYGSINSPPWRKRMDEVMEVACSNWQTDPRTGAVLGYPRTKFHMLRGLAFAGGPFPLYSADSASVARSWAGSPKSGIHMKDIAKFYASFDGRNPKPYWVRPVQQDALFAEDEPVLEVALEDLDGAALLDPHPDEDRPAKPLTRMASNRVQGELI